MTKSVFIAVAALAICACSPWSDSVKPEFDLEVELKAPASGYPANFRLAFITDQGSQSSPLYGVYLELPRPGSIVAESFLLTRRSSRRAYFAVEENRETRTVVWRLPTKPRTSLSWTTWSRPDFFESSDQGHWNLINDLAHGNRSEAIPADSYLGRFRFIPYPRPPGYVEREPPQRRLLDPQLSGRRSGT